MTNCYLGIDAGGTSTRAAVVRADGTCVGVGRAGSGNPISAGPDHAAAQVLLATRHALEDAGIGADRMVGGIAAMAGSRVARHADWLNDPLHEAGIGISLTLEPDLLAAFLSATPQPDGYAVVAGTGAVAVRVRGFELEAVTDGLGWLLGDAGSGFWIGHQAIRHALAALDGRAPASTLTDALLESLELDPEAPAEVEGRPGAIQHAVDLLYTWRPVELARLAPLAFTAAQAGDPAAVEIVDEAGRALRAALTSMLVPEVSGPLVFGGSVLTQQPAVASAVAAAVPGQEPLLTSDGLVGAAVLALRRGGVTVSEATFDRLSETIAARRN
ncbi:N-acetylglucosamine kinase [Ruania alba]|uniref:BadF-type ATPase n=1 Tax=Ruania alba TaxID=648782 RepID=A0A1H5GH18_9MICO|nr:BadF/BadG/BcrA/BcrD ATPase family protein [Ruania alba]SEE15033.1 BadF-type ATPase [Ruania alba]